MFKNSQEPQLFGKYIWLHANKIYNEISPTFTLTHTMNKIEKIVHTKCWWVYRKTNTFIHDFWKWKLVVQLTWEIYIYIYVVHTHTYITWPSNFTLGINPTEIITYDHFFYMYKTILIMSHITQNLKNYEINCNIVII